MGRSKAWLPFGPERLLQRVVRIVQSVAAPVVVVAGPAQPVPSLPEDVRLLRDQEEHLGPLAGLSIGLSALQEQVDAAFVSACDVPLLMPEFVRLLVDRLGDHEAAVVWDGRHDHSVAAVYRTRLADRASRLVAAGQLRLKTLLDQCNVRRVGLDEVKTVDPNLRSLQNINTREEYHEALRQAGLGPDCPSADDGSVDPGLW